MKKVLEIIKNIRNTLTYILVILIYFFLINIEANNNLKIIEKEEQLKNNNSGIDPSNLKIKIPVIPYNE